MIKKILIGTLSVSLLFIIAAYGTYKLFYPGDKADRNRKTEITGEDKFTAAGKINIAVMGVDERSDDQGRTDTLFVIMYDPKTEKVAMLSVPRDTRVRIAEHGWDKINHAYNYGGADSTVKTLENFLGVHIDYYVKVDFKGFVQMVDALGGVEVYVEKRMYYEDPWDDDGLVIDLQPGLQKLDGEKAIQYVRYRDGDGDIGRVARQQNFISAVYDKMSSPSMFTKIPSLVKVALDSVTTDMGAVEMLKIGKTLHKNSKAGFHTMSVPGEPVFIDEVSYWIPDVVALRAEVADVLGIDASSRFMSSARSVAQTYKESLPEGVDRDGVIATDEETEKKQETKDTEDKKSIKKSLNDLPNERSGNNRDDGTANKSANKPVPPIQRPPTVTKPPVVENVPKTVRASIINCSGDPAGG